MSDQKVEEMDDKDSASLSLPDVSHAASQQSAVAKQTENLPDISSEADSVCESDSNVQAANAGMDGALSLEGNINQNASSNMDNVHENCSDRQHPSGSTRTLSEANGDIAAACSANFGGLNLGAVTDFEAVLAQHRERLHRMETERQETIRRVELAKAEIERAAQQMYGAVDNRVNELLADVAELRSEREAQVEEAQSRMQSNLASMNYYRMFAQHLLKYGSPADITHYGPQLHENAQRILNEPRPEVPSLSAESEAKMARVQAFADLDVDELRQRMGGNLVGHVTETEEVDNSLSDGISPYLNQPVLVASTAVGNGVCGTAFLEDSLYAVRDRSSVVEVYATSEGLVLSRTINVEQMTCPTSVVACSLASCLFVNDSQVCGLFRIPSSADVEVTLIPLDDIPNSLSAMANGSSVAVLFADKQVVNIISATDGNVMGKIQIDSVDCPMSAVPVNGENNGFVICSENENGSSWFIYGHRLEELARSMEEPVHLRSLSGISNLIPDPFGSYIGFDTTQHSIKLFDSAFECLRPLLSRCNGVEHPSTLALNSTNGRLAVGQRNGVIHLYQVLHTRVKVEVGICNWADIPELS